MDAFPQICKKKKLLVTPCMLSFARAIKLIIEQQGEDGKREWEVLECSDTAVSVLHISIVYYVFATDDRFAPLVRPRCLYYSSGLKKDFEMAFVDLADVISD